MKGGGVGGGIHVDMFCKPAVCPLVTGEPLSTFEGHWLLHALPAFYFLLELFHILEKC